MSKYHYVYHSYEEWGRDYIGVRSCNCLPEEDTKYFGSFKDKTFFPTEKTILFVCKTREEVAEIEIELHDFFDVAVNPQFANMAKATSTKFDRTGVPRTEAQNKARSGEKHPLFGVPRTEEQKKAHSERMSGENNPNYGVPQTEAQKKANSERNSGEKNPRCRAIIAIQPDGTERHFWGASEAAKELKTPNNSLCYYLKFGHVLKCGKLKGWQFFYKAEVLN